MVRITRKITWLPIWITIYTLQYLLSIITYPCSRTDTMKFHAGESIRKLINPKDKSRSISPLARFCLSQNFFVVIKELFLYNFQQHKHMRVRRQFFKFSDGGIITLDWHTNMTKTYRDLKEGERPTITNFFIPNDAPLLVSETWVEKLLDLDDIGMIYRSSNPIALLIPGFNCDSRELFM